MNSLVNKAAEYIYEVLGVDLSIQPWQQSAKLPYYLNDQYQFFSISLLNRQCLFMVANVNGDKLTPAQVRKHWQTLQDKTGTDVIYIVENVSSYNRKRLVEQKVPFVVPGNQLYLPFLAIDLREQFKTSESSGRRTLSPAAQVVLLLAIYRQGIEGASAKQLAERLQYSAMTMTRAVNELANFELADLEWNGREKCLRFKLAPNELWQVARSYLKNPVKKTTWISPYNFEQPVLLAGESALAEYTDIAAPSMQTMALAASDWNVIKKQYHIQEMPHAELDFLEVQLWHYKPELLSADKCVDKLSLWLSLRHIEDIRVEMALTKMMESMKW